MKRTTLLTALLVGCSSRPDPAPSVPVQAKRPAAPKQLTADECNRTLVGKNKAAVKDVLGTPTGTFSSGWKYADKVWSDDLQKHVALWVYFGTDGTVIKCE